MMNNILLITTMAALLSAPLIYLGGRVIGKKISWAVLLVLLGLTAFYAYLFPTVESGVLLEVYNWVEAPLKMNFGFLADGLSIPVSFTFLFISSAVTLFSFLYMERRFSVGDVEVNNEQYARYYTLLLLYSVSVAGSMLSTNLIQFYLFFETALIFSWLLILFYGYGDRKRNALLYFLYTQIGSGVLLVGVLGVYWAVGSFEIADLANISLYPSAFWIGIAILFGILVKIGALGLHGWMPDTYSESPAPISAVLGSTSVMLSTYALARFMPPFQNVLAGVSGWIMLWALLTILYAGIMALKQSDTKRLVAYLSLSQMNYCLLGVFTFIPYGVLGAISYSISHGIAIALLFLVSGALLYRTNSRDMNKMGGLGENLPVVLLATIAGFLTIGGIPPAVGFKSKFILLSGAFERGFQSGWLEFIVAILAGTLATVITIGYEFRTIKRVFYGKLQDGLAGVKSAPVQMAVALIALGALSIMFGIWPSLITNPIEVFIEHIFH
jgi:NADH-quinone oxidoreductase subunit M